MAMGVFGRDELVVGGGVVGVDVLVAIHLGCVADGCTWCDARFRTASVRA
jgi:hypothetical protein